MAEPQIKRARSAPGEQTGLGGFIEKKRDLRKGTGDKAAAGRLKLRRQGFLPISEAL